MMKKIIGFIICTLLIGATIYHMVGNADILNLTSSKIDSDFEYFSLFLLIISTHLYSINDKY